MKPGEPFDFPVTITTSSSRSAIAGLLAGSVPPDIVHVPAYEDGRRGPRSSQILAPK